MKIYLEYLEKYKVIKNNNKKKTIFSNIKYHLFLFSELLKYIFNQPGLTRQIKINIDEMINLFQRNWRFE